MANENGEALGAVINIIGNKHVGMRRGAGCFLSFQKVAILLYMKGYSFSREKSKK